MEGETCVNEVCQCLELLTVRGMNRRWTEIGHNMVLISETFSKPAIRKRLSLQVLETLGTILRVLADEFDVDSPRVATAVTETFRALRNICVGEPRIQKAFTERTVAVDETCSILKSLTSRPGNQYNVTCLKVGTQFLGNLVVNNKETQPVIWNKCSEVLIALMKYEDVKVANCSSMVIYNILLGCTDIRTVVEDSKEILKVLLDNAAKNSEFALYAVRLLLSGVGYLPKMYDKVDTTYRLLLLDALQCMVTDSDISIPVTSIKFLVKQFKDCSDCILKTCETYVERLEPEEVAELLQFLASASAENRYHSELQKDMSLLITCSVLLKNMHSLGKTGENNFTSIQKLSDLSVSTQRSDICEHPAFEFKSCLVKLLGNLCWRHPQNQNQVRELDCIPVLLDCCNIDARNPFIMQWAVLAIRNLCENNLENQAVIASMTRKGTVDSSVLLEMGLTLHASDEGKIIVMPRDGVSSL